MIVAPTTRANEPLPSATACSARVCSWRAVVSSTDAVSARERSSSAWARAPSASCSCSCSITYAIRAASRRSASTFFASSGSEGPGP